MSLTCFVVLTLSPLPSNIQASLVSSNAFMLLNGFCEWQHSVNGRDGPHHDIAVMVTRKEICEGTGSNNCGTLGMSVTAVDQWTCMELDYVPTDLNTLMLFVEVHPCCNSLSTLLVVSYLIT